MADEDPRLTGREIAKRRHRRGWSQVDLARRIGVSPSTVANWERGVSYPRKTLGRVEAVLGRLDEPEDNEKLRERADELLSEVRALREQLEYRRGSARESRDAVRGEDPIDIAVAR